MLCRCSKDIEVMSSARPPVTIADYTTVRIDFGSSGNLFCPCIRPLLELTLVGMFTFVKAAVEQLVGRVGSTIASLDLVDESLQQRDRLMDR